MSPLNPRQRLHAAFSFWAKTGHRLFLGWALFWICWGNPAFSAALDVPDYQLYKNTEKFGIVVFPKENIYPGLEQAIGSLLFEPADSGKSVMRFGTKEENETFMMPLEVQKKHEIEKFIVVQVVGKDRMLIGVYDKEWGLTLPSSMFTLEELKTNIPKTLNVFRGDAPRKQIRWNPGPDGNLAIANPAILGPFRGGD